MNKNVVENIGEVVNFPLYMLLSKPVDAHVRTKIKWYDVIDQVRSNSYKHLKLPDDTGVLEGYLAGYNFSVADIENYLSTTTGVVSTKDLDSILNDILRDIEGDLEGSEIQNQYYAQGTSKVRYPNSYHNTQQKHIVSEHKTHNNTQTSLAIDIAPYPIDWDDMERFVELSRYVKEAAERLEVELDWGYDLWKWDAAHWQLTKYRK